MTESQTSVPSPAPGNHPLHQGSARHGHRRILIVALVLLLIPVLLVLLLRLDSAQRIVTTLVNRLAAPYGHVSGLGWEWPQGMRIEKVVLSDARGSWLEASDIHLKWSLWRFQTPAPDAPRVDIRHLSLLRIPEWNAASSASTLPLAIPWDWFVRHLNIQTLRLGNAWIPGGAVLTVRGGDAAAPEHLFQFTGSLQELGRHPVQATFEIIVPRSLDTVGVRMAVVEQAFLPVSGPWRLTARISRPWSRPQAIVSLQSDHLTSNHLQFHNVRAHMRLRPAANESVGYSLLASAEAIGIGDGGDAVTITHPFVSLNAHPEKGPLWIIENLAWEESRGRNGTASGTWDPTRQQGRIAFTGKAKLEKADLATFIPRIPPSLSGNLQYSGVADLNQAAKTIHFRIRSRSNRLTGWPETVTPWIGDHPGFLAKGIFIPGEKLELPLIRFQGQAFSLSGKTHIQLPLGHFSAQARARVTDLSPLSHLTGMQLAGQYTLQAQAGGPWSDPWVNLLGHGEQMRAGHSKVESLEAAIQVKNVFSVALSDFQATLHANKERLTLGGRAQWRQRDATLLFDRLVLTGPRAKITGQGSVPLKSLVPDGHLSGTLESLAALKPWHGQEWTGRVAVAVSLSANGRSKGHLNASDLAGTFGRLDKGEVRWDVPMDPRHGKLTTDITLHNFKSPRVALNRVEIHGEGNPEEMHFNLSGAGRAVKSFVLSARGKLFPKDRGGRLHLSDLEGKIDGERFLLQKPWMVTLTRDELLTSQLNITLAQTRMTGSLERNARKIDGQCLIHGDVTLMHRLGLLPVGGEMTLAASVRGTPTAPDLDMTLRGKNLRDQAQRWRSLPPLGLVGRVRVTQGKQAHVDLDATGLGKTPVHLTGELPLRLGFDPLVLQLATHDPLSVHLDATLALSDLAVWLRLGEEHRFQGDLRTTLQASGSLNQPRLEGTLEMVKGTYENSDLGTVFKDILLKARANGKEVTIDQITLSDGHSGQILARGRWLLDRDSNFPLQISMNLNQARILNREDTKATLNGQLTLEGALDSLDIRGNLTAQHTDYQLNDLQSREELRVVKTKKMRSSKQAKETLPNATSAKLDIQLAFPGHTYITGRGLNSEWHGNLHIQGTMQEPTIDGILEMERGHLFFVNRRYALKKGSITFDGRYPTTPNMDVEAVSRTRNLEITANLEGPVTNPRLKFSSDPSLPEDDILANLLFGRPANAITPAQAIKLATTIQSLRSGGPGIVDDIGQRLGIDQLDFKGDSVETGTINAGKYITDKIYLEVQKGIKTDADRITLEYGLTPEISLQTGVDAKSNTDIGILWNKDY
ncbi:MAG: translocation/assembly module TamB [Magnetococcales bacterium]|nr:translocation/assembly module TamB [Magnetococcales bacterium]